MKDAIQIKEVEKNDIELGELLRDGAFGALYKGLWNHQEVVIKKPLFDETTEDYSLKMNYFKNEMALHKKLSHRNIVKLLTSQYDSENLSRCYIVLEFIYPGDLLDFLSENEISLGWRISILEEISQALNYLHALRIIHRDLKPENILIQKTSTGLKAKLCDFGFAMELPNLPEDSFQDDHILGAVNYLAPEIIGLQIYSLQSDVYALGMIAYTLVAMNPPFSELLGSVDNSYSESLRPATCSRDPEILLNAQRYCTEIDRSGSREQVAGRRDPNCQQTLTKNLDEKLNYQRVLNAIEKGKRPKISDSYPKKVVCFIEQCWQQNPEDRPLVKDLLGDNLFNLDALSDHAPLQTLYTCFNFWSKTKMCTGSICETEEPINQNFCNIS